MKQVDYSKREDEILFEGDYNERHYIIRYMGHHPCAYVEFKNEFEEDSEEWNEVLCHCGINYKGPAFWNKDDNKFYIGWDYGHLSDWSNIYTEEQNMHFNNRKWTTSEIYEEVKNVIDYLNRKIKLKDTINMMNSPDYKERFKAEYYQLKIRYEKLSNMVEKWDKDELNFTPTCPRQLYDFQLKVMKNYIDVLVIRASIEKIDL